MVTDLQTRPPEDDQKAVDDEFDSMVGSGALGDDPEEKSLSADAIGDLENSANNPEESDPAGEADQVGAGYTGGGGKKKGSSKKKLAIGGGIGAMLVGGIIGIMAFLQPFFLTHIVNFIENQVGEVPSYAIERRMQYYINRYLIMQTLGTGDSIDGDNRFTYLGDGFTKTMYTNWRGARIEKKMAESGLRLEARVDGADLTKDGMRADKWDLVDISNPGEYGPGNRKPLSAPEARKFIRDYSKRETSSHRLWKRHTIRKMAKRYYGVPDWKPFEKTRDNARQNYRDRKKAFKKNMILKVTDRVNKKNGVWLNCILNGQDDCRNKRMNVPDENPSLPNSTGDPEADEELDNNLDNDSDGGSRSPRPDLPDAPGNSTSNAIFDVIKKFGMRKLLASFASGIGILDTIFKIVQSVDSGSINAVLYNRALQQYGAFAAPVLSSADQFRSGDDFDGADLRVMSDMFKNFQQSPVYQSTQRSAEANEGKSIHRDCNNDGDTTDDGDALDPGELVCPDKKAIVDKTKFTNNPVWEALAGLADAYDSTIGWAVDLVSDITGAITSAVGIDDFMAGVMDALGISEALAGAFESLMNSIFGIAVSGAETGPEAFDAVYGGIDGMASSAGGGIGDRTEGDSTIGGGPLNLDQVTAIQTEMQEQKDYELKNMSLFARYFSPEIPESLTSYAILNNPGVGTSAIQRFAGMFKISGFSSLLSNLTSKKVNAIGDNTNPFGYVKFGFAADHPLFAANNGDGMDPDEVKDRYKCDLPPEDRPQNQTIGRPPMGNGNDFPFEVNTESDPCMLEEAVVKAATMKFTGDYDDDIDGGGAAGDAVGGAGVPSGDAQELARRILNTPSISFDSDSVRAPIQQIADGQPASVPSPEAPAPTTQIAIELLQLIVAISDQGIPLRISSVTTGDHSSTSTHYVGKGLDIGNEEEAGRIMPFIFDNREQFKVNELFFNGTLDKTLDEGQPYGQSVSGHDNHIHVSVF